MEELNDFSSFNWIKVSLPEPKSSEGKDWKGNFVSDCLPNGFEAYCKIFHPIFIDLTIKDENLTWNDAEKENLDSMRGPFKEVLKDAVVTGGMEKDLLISRRIFWKDLFKKYGLKFHPEANNESLSRKFPGRSWPRQLVGPAEGSLDEENLLALMEIFKKFNATQRCFFYFDLMKTTDLKDRLFTGSLSEINDFSKNPDLREPPTYCWPEDESWCLYMDHDLTFTFLGANSQVVDLVLNSEVLEALPASLKDRVDYKADQINKPV